MGVRGGKDGLTGKSSCDRQLPTFHSAHTLCPLLRVLPVWSQDKVPFSSSHQNTSAICKPGREI